MGAFLLKQKRPRLRGSSKRKYRINIRFVNSILIRDSKGKLEAPPTPDYFAGVKYPLRTRFIKDIGFVLYKGQRFKI
jgi:hypothetical protein